MAAQSQVFINDNAAKLMLMTLAIQVLPSDESKHVKTTLAILIVIPSVLLAPLVGWFADRFAKRDVLIYSQWAQMLIMLALVAGLLAHSMWAAAVGFFLLGLQLSVFAPAKQGAIKEIVGSERLTWAVGWMEVTAISSILLGSYAGGVLYDTASNFMADKWDGAVVSAAVLAFLAALGLWFCYRIDRTPAQSNEPFRAQLLWDHFIQVAHAWKDRPIRLCIMGNAYFYALGGALYLTVLEVSNHIATPEHGAATIAGTFMAELGLGVIIGSLLVNKLTPHEIELGLIPIGTLGMISSLAALGCIDPNSKVYDAMLVALGVAGGFFVVPLNAYLQDRVPPDVRGRILSANNLVLNLAATLFIAVQYMMTYAFKLSPAMQCIIYAIPTAAVCAYVIVLLPENLLRFFLGVIARFFYRVHGEGKERIPREGGVLLLPNHISYMDAVILQLACPRPIRFLVYDSIYHHKYLNWLMKLLRAIPVSPRRARSALDKAMEALQAGEVVCIFPEGALTRTATLLKINRGYEVIADKMNVPLIPVWLENLWGSIFSYYGAKYFWKWPKSLPYHAWVFFGPPLEPQNNSPEEVRRQLYDLGERAFSARPELKSHVGYEALRGLKQRFFHPIITDAYRNGQTLKGGKLLAVGLTLAMWLRKNVPEKRVGVVLPPGVGATLVNLACAFADKTPVNLNFTAGRDAIQSSISTAQVRTVITAQAMVDRLKDFPWPEQRYDLTQIMQCLPKSTMVRWLLKSILLPSSALRWLAGVPSVGDRAEAGLLFTSGSAGAPKGVVLSHRNILANTAQIGAIFAQTRIESILGCLPIFHSFGYTVTHWWPIFGGPKVVTYTSPLETQKIVEVLEKYHVSLIITTPTFLRGYLRKAEPRQLKSVKFIVTGAEKLPLDLADMFEKHFQIPVCEGYGMTEATPVVSTNLPNHPPTIKNPEGVLCRRAGSVGRLLPGMSISIRHPETGRELSIFESGMVWLKGANIFDGYLNDEQRTQQVMEKGWYKTGDIGRIDEDGFLYIEGRLNRFSKIGGEMVPHQTVEQKIIEAAGLRADAEQPQICVVGVPDETKGEALVLLTSLPIDLKELRSKLLEMGLTNLWIPKSIKKVDAIPVLATGKLDIQACQKLAAQA